jgi:iron complex outermembrane recepter protein
MKTNQTKVLLVFTFLGLCQLASANAQTTSSVEPLTELPTIVVTAAAMGANSNAVPSTIISGEGLTVQKSNTLGDLLSREVGISTTGFGTNASRPVIRGLDAERIKLLSNGSASRDVAGLSYDHATPIDPLVIERIEVLRGPSTLLYGGGAVGGVVNALDNRIPATHNEGLTGSAELRGESAKREGSASAVLEAGLGKDWMYHLDAFRRDSSSLAVPIALPCTVNSIIVIEKKSCNTQSHSNGGALGLSRLWSQGFIGMSISTYQSNYGTPAEDEVTIGMKSTTLSLKSEQRGLEGWVKAINFQANASHYEHTEFDAGTPATEFKKHGKDAKVELHQRDKYWNTLKLTGTTIFSTESEQFNALGSEAFVPKNKTSQSAIASLQTLSTDWGSVTGGMRIDKVNSVSSGGTQTDYLGNNKFTAAAHSFTPSNLALSSAYVINKNTQLMTNFSSNQRAPSAYELFANGVHIATAAYETGNQILVKERSQNIDLSVQWRDGFNHLKVGGFYNRFKNFISLSNTGNRIGADGELNPLDTNNDAIADGSGETIYSHYQYKNITARFMGIEAQGQYRLITKPYTLDINARFDTLTANNAATGEPLPRIAPTRVTVGASARFNGWTGKMEWAHNAKQNKQPSYDSFGSTPSYSIVNVSLSYRNPEAGASLWFVKLDNAFNQLGYNAVTIDTVRGKAPLAGRNLKIGVQHLF